MHDNNKIESTVNTQPLSFSTPPSTVNNHSGYTGIDIILKQALIKVPGRESAYSPDVLVINPKNHSSEPLWKKSSTVTQAASVLLVIEVVSTNWQNDYSHKLVGYEISGIPEYWIINYSNPKSFVNFLFPPPGFGEGWGGVKKLRLLQGLLYLGLGCGMCSKF